MNRIAMFRILLVLFVILYVAAFRSQDLGDTTWNSELHEYQERLEIQFGGFRPGLAPWVILWLLGHLIEVIGLVLLFCRVRRGLWPAGVGAILAAYGSWFVSQPDFYPNLQTTTNRLLWSATCIVWGVYVCMALTDQQNLFAPVSKA